MTSGEQCCPAAEISTKKLKRGRGKIKLAKEFVAEFFTNRGRKGAEEYFLNPFTPKIKMFLELAENLGRMSQKIIKNMSY
jgi:hypothetical protein